MNVITLVARLALWCGGLLLGALVLGLVAPSHGQAATQQLHVRVDGQPYHHTVNRPLFDTDRLWVPGDAQTVPVWAHNRSSDAARLNVEVHDERGPAQLRSALQIAARADGVLLPAHGSTGYLVQPGAAPTKLDLTLTFPADSTNAAQKQRASFRLTVSLVPLTPNPSTSAAAAAPDQPAPTARDDPPTARLAPDDQPGWAAASSRPDARLPATGAPPVAGVLLLALASLTAGALLLPRLRRSARKDRHV